LRRRSLAHLDMSTFRNFISAMKYYLDRTETERTLVSSKKVDIQSSEITIKLFLLSTKRTNKSSDIRINDRLLVYVLCEGLITGLKIYPEDRMVAK